MSISHTPGPWKWLSNKRQGGRMLVAADESEIVLARATCHRDQSREQGLRRLANVRLITAAPELLATLEYIERACDGTVYDESPGEHERFIANVRELASKAIAKART